MLIETIYKKVYADLPEQTGKDDFSMSGKLDVLIEETNLEELDKEKLALLMCRASVIGQEQGFVSGWKFALRLLAESL